MGVEKGWIGSPEKIHGVNKQLEGVRYYFQGQQKYLSEDQIQGIEATLAREGRYKLVKNGERRWFAERAIEAYERMLKDRVVHQISDIGPIYESDVAWGGLLYFAGDRLCELPGEALQTAKFVYGGIKKRRARQKWADLLNSAKGAALRVVGKY